jgi:hypothetical protein
MSHFPTFTSQLLEANASQRRDKSAASSPSARTFTTGAPRSTWELEIGRRKLTRFLHAAVLLVVLGAASPALAQTRAWPERFWFGVSGGIQPTVNSFDDAFERELYQETERVTIGYPVKSGALIAATGGVRVWKRLAVGFGATRYNRRGSATVQARLPHPFFDNQFREIEGTTTTTRKETGAHLLVGWMMPLGDTVRLIVTAGPSVLSVGQTLVTDVQFAETFPYDTAEFTAATTTNPTRTATGFNAGADLFWMFARRFGAGGLVQVTRARARLNAGSGRTVSIDAGGAQAALGIRLIF